MPGFQLNVKYTWTYSQFRLVVGLAAGVTGPFSETLFCKEQSGHFSESTLFFSFSLHVLCAVLCLVTQSCLF